MKIESSFFSHNGKVEVSFYWQKGIPFFLSGKNGIGKSSFFHYLKNHVTEIFPNLSSRFMDQGPLTALGNGKVIDLFHFLAEEFSDRRISQKDDLSDFTLLDQFNFRSKLSQPINSLSGGENQTLKILIQYFLKSDLYFFDEPTQHLDAYRKNKFYEILMKNNFCQDHYFLIIEHSIEFPSHFQYKKLFIEEYQERSFKIIEGGAS